MEKIIHFHNASVNMVQNQIINDVLTQHRDLNDTYDIEQMVHMVLDVDFQSVNSLPKHAQCNVSVHLYSHPESKSVEIFIPTFEHDQTIHNMMIQYIIVGLIYTSKDITVDLDKDVIQSEIVANDECDVFIKRYMGHHDHRLNEDILNELIVYDYTFDTHTKGLLWLFTALSHTTFLLFRMYESVTEKGVKETISMPDNPKASYEALPATIDRIVSKIQALPNHEIVTHDDLIMLDRILTDASISYDITFAPFIDINRVPLKGDAELYGLLMEYKMNDDIKERLLETWRLQIAENPHDENDEARMMVVSVEPQLYEKSDSPLYANITSLYDKLEPEVAAYYQTEDIAFGYRVHYAVDDTMYHLDVLLLPEINHIVYGDIKTEHRALYAIMQDILTDSLHDYVLDKMTNSLLEQLEQLTNEDDEHPLKRIVHLEQFMEFHQNATYLYTNRQDNDIDELPDKTNISVDIELLHTTFQPIADIYKDACMIALKGTDLGMTNVECIAILKQILRNMCVSQDMYDTPHTTSVERFQFVKRLIENELLFDES